MVHAPRATILIVEDDEALRTLYRGIFHMAGHHAITAPDGLDALRMIDQHRPDAVVLDLGLPRLSGRDVGRELAQRLTTRRIPVIVVTGGDIDDLEGTHFAAVLRKPVDPGSLVGVVEDAIRRRGRAAGV